MASFYDLYEIAKIVQEDVTAEPIWQLDEAIDNFQQLPDVWKKSAAKTGLAGQDSEVKVLATSAKAKDPTQVTNFMRKAITLTRDTEGAAIAWVEFKGEPFVGVMKAQPFTNTPEYTILVPAGATTGSKSVTAWGTGKWDRRLGKYIPPVYSKYTTHTFKPGDAAEQMWSVVRDFGLSIFNAIEGEKPKDWFELIVGTPFTVKVLLADANRKEKKAERTAARAGANTDIDTNKKAALKKLVSAKIDPIIDSVKADVQALVDKALAGQADGRQGSIDFSQVEKKLRKISSVVSALNSATSGKDKFRAAERKWGSETGKVEPTWQFDSLMKSIERALGE